MIKKALDEKYAYQIDEHNIVHLFRGKDDCQQYLTNPLLSAIFKIETLEKENAELKELLKDKSCLDCNHLHNDLKLTKVKELFKDALRYLDLSDCVNNDPRLILYNNIEQFLKENEE